MMLVINPLSGRGLSKSAIGTIVSQLCGSGYAVTVYFSGELSPQQLTCEYAKYHDLIVCVGGDGTFSSVVSGLLSSDVQIPVGYIPAGTANDVATTLTLSKNPQEAAQKIINGKPWPLDIGKFIERHFTYIAAFGAFTGVSYQTPQSAKRALGHFAYVLGGLADMSTIKARRVDVKFHDKAITGDFIFGGVMNSTSVAGLVKLDPNRVDLADGLFEVILVKQPLTLVEFMGILTSIANRSYQGDNVQLIQAKSVKFKFENEVAWTIDGDDGGSHKEALITNCHEAIRIIM